MIRKCLFILLAAAALAGCRSDLYYQDRAVERAREFLLKEKSGELTVEEMNFVRFNTPVLLHSPVLGDAGRKDAKEKLKSEFHQVCVTWIIPGRKDLYMVFGVSSAGMADWRPNRVLVRDYSGHVPAIAAASEAARGYAKNNLFSELSVRESNFVRFTFPWLIRTDFGLNFDPGGTLSAEELETRRKEASAREQYSLVWKLGGGRNLVFAGLADKGFKDWTLNFAGFIGDGELDEHTAAVLLTPDEGLNAFPGTPAADGKKAD